MRRLKKGDIIAISQRETVGYKEHYFVVCMYINKQNQLKLGETGITKDLDNIYNTFSPATTKVNVTFDLKKESYYVLDKRKIIERFTLVIDKDIKTITELINDTFVLRELKSIINDLII